MAQIMIKDLEMNKELDKKAMKNVAGGWGCRTVCQYVLVRSGWSYYYARRCYRYCYY